MSNVLIRKQISTVLSSFLPTTFKLSYSDSALIHAPPSKLKDLVEEDFSRVLKRDFRKCFVENLFVNKFQENVLEYPQLDSFEETEVIKKHVKFAQKLIEKNAEKNEPLLLSERDSKKAVSFLKQHELSGFKMPRLKNGFGYLTSEYTFIQEALGRNPSLVKTISEHEDFGILIIDLYGTDAQKGQYLMKLINGESFACFAHCEPETLLSLEQESFNTTAMLSSDNEKYIISGKKCLVYNANSGNLFILSANIIGSDGKKDSKPTLFLIDRNTPGIVVHEPIETVGLKELTVCDVSFNEVIVPSSSVLGDISHGGTIIKKVLSKGKLNNGGRCIAIMRKLLEKTIHHCINNEFFDKDKFETDYFRIKVGNLASRLYSVESMTYLVTGRFDLHHDADVFLESVIVKIFASESLQFTVDQTVEILGTEFFTSDNELVELSRDAQFYAACDDANDYLRLVLATAGLKHAMDYHKSKSFLEMVSQTFNLQNFRNIMNTGSDKLVYKNKLFQYLHLIFLQESIILEDAVYNLSFCTKYLIKKYGKNALERHFELKNLADLAINAYVCTATLARASRAYCLGVKFQEIDRLCAHTQVFTSALQTANAKELIINSNSYLSLSEIAQSIQNSGKYSELYPIFRNLVGQQNIDPDIHGRVTEVLHGVVLQGFVDLLNHTHIQLILFKSQSFNAFVNPC